MLKDSPTRTDKNNKNLIQLILISDPVFNDITFVILICKF